jgi:hypothetical protein
MMVDRGPSGNVIGGAKLWTKKWRRAERPTELHDLAARAMWLSEQGLLRVDAAEGKMPDEFWGLHGDYIYAVRACAKYADALLDRLEQADA